MATSYPAAVDSFDPPGANLSTNPHSAMHTNVQDAVEAVQTELGTAPSGTFSTVKARLDSNAAALARHGCKIRRSTNQSIPNTGDLTLISFNTEDSDTDGFFAPTSSSVNIPAGLAGLYGITGKITWAVVPPLATFIGLRAGGDNFMLPAPGSVLREHGFGVTVPLVAADIVQLWCAHSGGGSAINVTATLYVHRVGL